MSDIEAGIDGSGQPLSAHALRVDRISALLAFVWPFCYLCVYFLPFDWALGIGNDFVNLYYRYKHYLLDVLSSNYAIPLWSPTEGAGFPFYSNPFAAALYPLNLLLAVWYRVAGGYSNVDHTVFTIFGVSIFCLGTYKWLRSLQTEARPALLSSLIMGTSFKMTEILRFPNAVHAAAWMPWILYGLTLALRPGSIRSGMAIVSTATLMLLTAGYPYYAYYLQFLVGPYLLFLLVRRSGKALQASGDSSGFIGAWRGLAAAGVAFGLPLILCSPYLSKMKTLLDQTADRAGRSYAYSTAHEWGLLDTLGSLLYPPAAMAEGWYYFGVLGLMVILLHASGGFPGTSERKRERTFFAMMLAWFLLVTYVTFGKRSHLFDLLWRTWPGFAALRVWPRLNIVLVPLFALLFSRAYSRLETTLREAPNAPGSGSNRAISRLAVLFALILSLQSGFLIATYTSGYWGFYFQPMNDYLVKTIRLAFPDWPGFLSGILVLPATKAWFPVASIGSALFLGLLLLRCRYRPVRTDSGLWIVMVSFLAVNVLDVAPLGVRQWITRNDAARFARTELKVGEWMPLSLVTPRTWCNDTIQLGPRGSVGTVENWYFERYTNFLKRQSLSSGAAHLPERIRAVPGLETLLGLSDGRRLFASRKLNHPTVEAFVSDATATEDAESAVIDVVTYDGDRLEVRVEATSPVYVSFIDNWDPDWRARIDGNPAGIELLFGTFKAVRIQPGTHVVRFEYAPFSR